MKLLNYFLAALFLPGALLAQDNQKNKEVEQIIITKKRASDEKLNIVVDGDKVSVNGKLVDTDKDADISVKRMKIKNMDDYRDLIQNRVVRGMALPPTAPASPNKAMLGVSTQKATDGPGVEVKNVAEESAEQKAGLKEGDLIFSESLSKSLCYKELRLIFSTCFKATTVGSNRLLSVLCSVSLTTKKSSIFYIDVFRSVFNSLFLSVQFSLVFFA